ncbi:MULTISPECIES: hypothetical protein [unclassified Paenibacillus]|uniref:hypothetical protein n=1 Tax=unclassified Paenibacillus TaxID=185978 RepID=UPI0027D811AF|nr:MULTISPECIES: hypothetical protein [unclassified Paenibacillus]
MTTSGAGVDAVGTEVGTGVAEGAGLGVIEATVTGVELVVAIGLTLVWFALQAANKIMTLIISTLAFLFIILRSPQVFIL